MLPSAHRLRRSRDFAAVLRRGRRVARGTVVVHLLVPDSAPNDAAPNESAPVTTRPRPSRVGLIVGKPVGNSVVRHQVSRRLRAVLAARIDEFPGGSDVVVRALPAAAPARSAVLDRDVEQAVRRLIEVTGHGRHVPVVSRRGALR